MCDGPEDPGYHIGGNVLIVLQIGEGLDLRHILVQGEARCPNSKGQQLVDGHGAGKSESGPGIQFRVAMTWHRSPLDGITSMSGSWSGRGTSPPSAPCAGGSVSSSCLRLWLRRLAVSAPSLSFRSRLWGFSLRVLAGQDWCCCTDFAMASF